jgi:hypothetical protein
MAEVGVRSRAGSEMRVVIPTGCMRREDKAARATWGASNRRASRGEGTGKRWAVTGK